MHSIDPEANTCTAAILIEVMQERRRQIHGEGCTPARDDRWRGDQLAMAAVTYALPAQVRHLVELSGEMELWPFADGPKFKDRRRDLVRAAALLVAEIERFDRARAVRAIEAAVGQ